MTRIRTQGRIAVAAVGVVMAVVGVAGCGGESAQDAEPAAEQVASASAAAEPAPSAKALLELVDDQESAGDEEIVVQVLQNDTVTLGSGTSGNVQMVLDDETFAVTVDSPPAHGTATVDGNTIVYKAVAGYDGEDTFTYKVDVTGSEAVSGTAVVRITVDAPAPPAKPAAPKKPAVPATLYANCAAAEAAGAAPVEVGDPGYGRHLDRDGDGVGCEPYSGGGGSSGGSSGGGSTGGGGGSVSYANCSEVRAAGAAPIRTGDPGYGRHLDRDGDGVACE
ncbi:excalibur calcium-binding domain-containing protein [Streptomyces sp. AM8-1-1]|uniref:excalibur calcium-binding domain-containing protein n=1 Tax=Streptomyces sp. AM8-1-1 TaxID=3075825 RepID=UPI0028C47DF0|nr:excalibur calcium-binding domain-containing protein [Streptomyces sp. AM8-1-1]WNO74376.1 excalibur calcium-binding domain-containing protein [Streptomyces sp. AM8-1-1]